MPSPFAAHGASLETAGGLLTFHPMGPSGNLHALLMQGTTDELDSVAVRLRLVDKTDGLWWQV
jgi:hypothetical protein